MSDLEALIEARNWPAVIQHCEQLELCQNEEASKALVVAVQLFAYLIVNDLNSARFRWKRTPSSIKAKSEVPAAAWEVVKNVWRREYPAIYKSLQNFAWPAELAHVVSAFAQSFRERTLLLLSRAHSNISLQETAKYLGLLPEETLAKVTQHGWKLDPNNADFFIVAAPAAQHTQLTGPRELTNLTEYIVNIEG